MRKLSVAALMLVLALSACSSNDDRSALSTNSKASPSVTATESEQDASTDQDIADAALLTIKDMPAGWVAGDPEKDDDHAAKAKIAQCVGVDYSEMYNDDHAEADSDEFTSPAEQEVSVSVRLGTSEQWMIRVFEIANSPEFRRCAVESLEDELGSDDEVELGKVSMDEMASEQLADGTNAFRITLPVTVQGQTFEGIIDSVVVRVGRAQVVLLSSSMGNPLSVEELSGFAKISVDRLQAGLAAS